VCTPVAITTASISPFLTVEPENTSSEGFFVAGRDSPVKADWSTLKASPSRRRASAGMISPNLMLIMSPGTKIAASSSLHRPSLRTYKFCNKKGELTPIKKERRYGARLWTFFSY
jgi:hypothetical protein